MAEPLSNQETPEVRRSIRIEAEPNGVIIIFADPRIYKVETVNGRSGSGTRELYTRVIISPWLNSLETNALHSGIQSCINRRE